MNIKLLLKLGIYSTFFNIILFSLIYPVNVPIYFDYIVPSSVKDIIS